MSWLCCIKDLTEISPFGGVRNNFKGFFIKGCCLNRGIGKFSWRGGRFFADSVTGIVRVFFYRS